MALHLLQRSIRDSRCPHGGSFYKCEIKANQKIGFTGCCDSNPCFNRICPREGHFAAYSDSSNIDGNAHVCPSGSTFYSCTNFPKRFVGCCGMDPCENDNVCVDLFQTYHFLVNTRRASNSTGASLASSQPPVPSSNSTVWAPPSPSSKASSYPSSVTGPHSEARKGSDPRLVVGSAIGGLAGVLLIIFLMLYYHRKAKESREHMDKHRTMPPAFDHMPTPPHHAEDPAMLESPQGQFNPSPSFHRPANMLILRTVPPILSEPVYSRSSANTIPGQQTRLPLHEEPRTISQPLVGFTSNSPLDTSTPGLPTISPYSSLYLPLQLDPIPGILQVANPDTSRESRFENNHTAAEDAT